MDKSDLKFLLSVDTGKVLMYGTTYFVENDLIEKVREPMSSYPFSNQGIGSQEMLIITKEDKKFCISCHFLVAVMAIADSDYSIVAAD